MTKEESKIMEGMIRQTLDQNSSKRAYCKGCESLDDLYENGFCAFCMEDVERGWRDEDTGWLTKEGEKEYRIRYTFGEVTDIELGGINRQDLPDLCDVFIESAVWKNTGKELTEEELEKFRDDNEDKIHEMAYLRATEG